MKIRSLLAVVALLGMSALGVHRAQASEVLYNGVGFMEGTQSFSDSFNLSSPGTLTVTLGDSGWPMPLASLNLLVSSSSGTLGPEIGVGTSTFAVSSGNVVAQWFGTAQGPLNAGVYSLEIQFQPGSSTVPLPTSVVLLLSGLGLLVWQRRVKTTDFTPA